MKEKSGKYKRYRKKKKRIDYRKMKALFLLSALLFVILCIVILFPKGSNNEIRRFTTSGICGSVKVPAVYRLPIGSDLGSLIMKAEGITFNADIRNVDLSHIIQHDSIYHIPSRERKRKLLDIIEDSEPITFQPHVEGGEYSFLYVGFPALYFLVTYYPEMKRINVVYIPHSTIMLSNEYRLIDVFFTLGIEPTIDILEKQLKRRIDYYFIQDRNSFIGMIDELDGLTIPVDTTYARAYGLRTGKQVLDGFLSWEYIRFIDPDTYRAKDRANGIATLENLELETKNIELAYDIRQMRQKKVISILYSKFKSLNYVDKSKMISAIIKMFNYNSDVPVELALELLPTLRTDTKLQFGTLPGYYQSEGDNVFYFPYENGVETKKKSESLKVLESANKKTERIIY
jgi:hypothetical protein